MLAEPSTRALAESLVSGYGSFGSTTGTWGKRTMNTFKGLLAVAASILCMGLSTGAHAQGLKEKVIGAWTLNDGSELFQDGKKLTPWVEGNLILDTNGHFSFFVLGKDRIAANDDVRIPSGPLVAYYGTYTVNDAENMLTYKVEHAANPKFDGAIRTQKVTFKGDLMTTTGSDVKTPQGTITPVNEWKKVK
jgi:hypothetical protein